MLPTVAELAGAEAPEDIDGISIVPELLGERQRPAASSSSTSTSTGNSAARPPCAWANWKAIQPGKKRAVGTLRPQRRSSARQQDLAADQPEVLAKMKASAEAAHEPVEEGVFHDREIHERDRRAKFGGKASAVCRPKVETRCRRRACSRNKGWKIARASSESGGNNGKARRCHRRRPAHALAHAVHAGSAASTRTNW